jgi:hypothetical protein
MFLLVLLACVALVLMLGAITHSASYVSQLSVTRTFSGESGTTTGNSLNTTTTLNAGTTPACSLDSIFTLALIAGAVTLDLTAIPDPNLGTLTGLGLTLNMLKLQNPAANANPITVKFGAANPYVGFGAAFDITLQPGEEFMVSKLVASAIAAGNKTLDFAGTGTQAINVQVVIG